MRMAGVTATVVLLVALVAGAWVYGGDGGDPSAPRSDTVFGDPRLPKAPEPPKALVQPIGTPSVEISGSPAEVTNAKVLGDADLGVIAPAVKTISALVSRDGELVRGTWLFALRKGQEPGALMDDITALYTKVGYQSVPTQPDVVALKFAPSQGPVTYRAHYVSSRGVVRVEAFGPDDRAAAKAFEELLSAQLRTLPSAS
jgi:hypothetical protein